MKAEVLADMEKEEANEVRELLGFEENTAGALMTTEYVVVHESATVEGAIAALRSFEGPLESIHVIYLVDNQAKLSGAVPVSRILLSQASVPLVELTLDPLISVPSHAAASSVVDLFHKYNLVSLPVVDDGGHLIGVVTADDVLELVISKRQFR
jgi:Mg/Co/Ni transporter MgtE